GVLCCEELRSVEDLSKTLLLSSSEPPPSIACTCGLPTSWYHPKIPSPLSQHPIGSIPAMQPESTGHFAINCFPETDAQAPPAL
ncbi:hypothetical protein LEMLEM_LOCUS25418, partial [Lemmus lemmus]